MTRRSTAAALCLALLSGCQWLLGGDGAECAATPDCPERMLCQAARCVVDPDPPRDARVADEGPPDMAADLAQDAGPAAPLDMAPPPVDAAPPGEIEPPFPDGQCFSNSGSIQLGAGVTYVPHGLCTRFGVLWATDTPGGRALNIARVWPPDEAVIALPMAPDARVSTVDGRFIAYAAPGLDDAPAPVLLDLAMRAPEPSVIRDLPVSEVRRGHGLTAYVSDGALFLNPDAEMFSTFVDCSQPGARQWGVALSEGRVAWFERARIGGPTRVVIADLATCAARVVFPARGDVAADARIEAAGERWLWIAAGPTRTQVVGLAPDARARLRPFALEMPTTPAQIAAQGDWLATVSYGEGAWRIEALHLVDDRVQDLSAGSSNHRNPLIWNGYLSWAVMTRQGWGFSMRRFVEPCIALALAGLMACSQDVSGDADPYDFGDRGPPVDMGDMSDGLVPPPECAPGEIFDGVVCVPLPADPCALIDPLLGAGCVDEDGDCFPAKCDDPLPDGLRDCDDLRADRHPGRLEQCDGVDNDCDDVVDDGLDLGEACSACGRDGVLECALDARVACSVEAGQSDAVIAEELCDSVDQDCDGAVDEGCLRPLPPADLRAPRWCGDRLLYLADGALMTLDLSSGVAALLDEGPVAEPACRGDVAVWLRAAGCEGGDISAPLICPAAQLMGRVVDVTRPLAPFGDLGAPVIGPDGVYLHERVGETTSLLRAPFDGLAADRLADAISDPTAPVDDLVIARARRGGALVMEGVGLNVPSRSLSGPSQTPPGRPARDARVIAWIAGAAPVLWVLANGPTSPGAQVGVARMGTPWVRGDVVFWLAPDGLRRFDARTGQSTVIDDAEIDPTRLWIGPPGRVQLVEGGARFWAMAPPDAEPEPPAPDAGPRMDAGVADGGLDAGVDVDASAPDASAPDAALDALTR